MADLIVVINEAIPGGASAGIDFSVFAHKNLNVTYAKGAPFPGGPKGLALERGL